MAAKSNMAGMVKEMQQVIDKLDKPLRDSFQNMHAGYPDATLERFLKARDDNVEKASKMLIDCLNWRVSNRIDNILAKPIMPKETFDLIRESQLIGFCGFCKQGRPVFAVGVGQSTFDQASVDKYVQSHIQINEYRDRFLLPHISKVKRRHVGSCLKILDMTGLRLSAFSRLKTSTAIATVDDLNYPEKTDTYYIVNAPYVFSACWKAVKNMLQERTKRKVQVLKGNGMDELLEVMDYDTLPLFCKSGTRENSTTSSGTLDVFSPSHKFHTDLYNHIKQNALASGRSLGSLDSEGSLHIKVPTLEEQDPHSETAEVVHAIESVLPSLERQSNKDQKQRDKLTAKIAGIQGGGATHLLEAGE